ncbi:MAG: cysteine--tRNA ligase [Candidatus Rehaiarchaeum fermentans]|nr:cysteine--tRNA ligase [Candidatus Rehaiarchaeum fermentans]
MRIFNTLSRKVEEFVPINNKEVRLYSCGPTVYDFAHIGNLRYFTNVDLLKRALLLEGYDVKHVMNITDVGHLTSDSDTGEDKIERSAEKARMSAWDLAKMYTQYFLEDIKELNIIYPQIICKATDHIKEMIEMIKKLEEKGFTYRIGDGIYYDTSKFPSYGELLGKEREKALSGALPGARVEFNPEKRNINDFALWKFSPKDKKRQMEWDSPWGVGFPGWHIECSAMSTKYLGNHFDIHAGGVDLIFPHHTNEIAQAEAANSEKFVNYWFHVEHLLINNKKMSKSEGNYLTLRDLKNKGFDPIAFRLMIIDHHYRNKLNFTFEKLEKYATTLERFDITVKTIPLLEETTEEDYLEDYALAFNNALKDDLDTHKALQIFSKYIDVLNDYIFKGRIPRNIKQKHVQLISHFNKVLGILDEYEIPEEIKALAEKRYQHKKAGLLEEADKIREEVFNKGYKIIDYSNSYLIIKRRYNELH